MQAEVVQDKYTRTNAEPQERRPLDMAGAQCNRFLSSKPESQYITKDQILAHGQNRRGEHRKTRSLGGCRKSHTR